jgi:hypothetical protein
VGTGGAGAHRLDPVRWRGPVDAGPVERLNGSVIPTTVAMARQLAAIIIIL